MKKFNLISGMTAFSLALSACATVSVEQPGVAAESAPLGDRLVLLGVKGGPVADPVNSEPASILMIGGRPYLIDAGAGVVQRLAQAGVQPADIGTIFLTHHHLDHTAGLTPLLALNWINTGLGGSPIANIDIYGPPATVELIEAIESVISVSERVFRGGIPQLPEASERFLGHDAMPGQVFADDMVRVTSVENSHYSHETFGPGGRDRSYSYRFETGDISIVFTGDTGPSQSLLQLASGADILVSEVLNPIRPNRANRPEAATGLREHMTREHMNGREVGELAASAGVKLLVLHHIPGVLSAEGRESILSDIRESYRGEVIVGADLMTVELSKYR